MRKDQYNIEKKLGLTHAKELWNMGLESVEEVKTLINKNRIDCHLVNGVMSAACFKKDLADYQFEIDHMSKNYQFEGYKFFNKKELRKTQYIELLSNVYK